MTRLGLPFPCAAAGGAKKVAMVAKPRMAEKIRNDRATRHTRIAALFFAPPDKDGSRRAKRMTGKKRRGQVGSHAPVAWGGYRASAPLPTLPTTVSLNANIEWSLMAHECGEHLN